MDADERQIYHYLKHRNAEGVAYQEIARRAGGRLRYQYSPQWARPVLMRMTTRDILDRNPQGLYRLKPVPRGETQGKRWTCPRIAQLLERTGKDFQSVITVDYEDTYYDRL
jgi:predicted transcriptional regulator of viral defense system